MVNIQKIFDEFRSAARANRGYSPDYVMIHPCNKQSLILESNSTLSQPIVCITDNEHKIFGIKIIWSENVKDTECICTYNSYIQH